MRPDALSLVAAGARLSSAGLSPGSTGNLSIRLDEIILSTPTGAELSRLDAEQLSVIDLQGAHVDGPKATKEALMHAAFYRAAAPDLTAIVHLHSTYATALSCLADLDLDDAIPPLTPYLSMRAGRVGVVPFHRPGDPAITTEITRRAAAGYKALLLANHGSIVIGTSIDDAVSIATELEESARLQLLLRGLPTRQIDPADRAILLG